MMTSLRRRLRPILPAVLAGILALSPVASTPALAQPGGAPAAEGESGEEGKGRSLDGYLLMVMLASLAFMVVGKTARR